MFHHVVLMNFSGQADEAFHRKVNSYCDQIRQTVAHCEHYVYAENIASRADGLTHGILSRFRSRADHDAYQVSAIHQEMKSYMAGFIERIVVCDLDEDQP